MNTTIALTGWSLDPLTRVLTAGQIVCGSCEHNRQPVPPGRHQVFGWLRCSPCKGTGRRGNGTCSKCSYYRAAHTHHRMVGDYRPGMVPDHSAPLDGGLCTRCDGTQVTGGYDSNHANSRLPEHIRQEVLAAIPVRVTCSGVGLSLAEQYLGAHKAQDDNSVYDALWSCTDWGNAAKALAEAVDAGADPAVWLEDFRQQQLSEIEKSLTTCNRVGAQLGQFSDRFLLADEIVIVLRPNGYTAYRVSRKENLPQ